MNVLLINPVFPDTFWGFKHALEFVDKRAAFPPLGLVTLAALLPSEWNLRLVDMQLRPLADEDLQWADMAMIGAMAVQTSSCHKVIARCHAAKVRIVAGGPLFTLEQDAFPLVDHFVLNEAEITLPPFLEDLKNGCAKRMYTSLEKADMHLSPVPRWDLLEFRRYGQMSVQYSRGCPFNCDFCNVTSLFGRRPRTKKPEQILTELNTLKAAGWNGAVFFVDDNLIGNPREVKNELFPALIEWQKDGGRMSFNTQVTINLADDEKMIDMIVRSGFDTVFIGIETPDTASLKECRKTQNTKRDMIADVRRLHHAGIEVQAGFIVGFDHDDDSIFQRQIDFIQASAIPTAMVGVLQAPPGTDLYTRMQRENRIVGFSSGDNVDGTTNIIPTMGLKKLLAGYRRVLSELYSPGKYYERVRTLIRERAESPVNTPMRREDFLAFARSMLRLGVLARERWEYWKLVFWTLLHKPASIDAAVTLSITGYHLRRICDAAIGRSKQADDRPDPAAEPARPPLALHVLPA